jgi:hypothetical protein
MFSVTVPVLVTITAFATPGEPTGIVFQVNDAGVTVTVGPTLSGVTVRLNVVVCVKLPETPWTVMVEVPVVAVAVAVKVSVLVVVAGLGLNPAVTPEGRPEALNVTALLKPLSGAMVIVLVPVLPCTTDTLVGFALRLKSGVPPLPHPGKMNDPMAVCQSNPPFTAWYSSVNQKVQSSVGSTVSEV